MIVFAFTGRLSILLLLSCATFGVIGGLSSADAQENHSGPSAAVSYASTPEFDVASIKRADATYFNNLWTYPGGRIVAKGAMLKFLLAEACGLQTFQVVGGPAWIDNEDFRFDIEAKPPAEVAARYSHLTGSPKNPPPDEIRQMLQNLLKERFQLKLTLQQREGPVIALVKSGTQLHLSPSKNEAVFPWAGSLGGGMPKEDGLLGTNVTMSHLASLISSWLSRPVVDQTGVPGSYDFKVVLSQEDIDAAGSREGSIIESLRQLGLLLKKSTGQVPTLVIEQASLPTAN
jgi:uncharacterized protein (TIGR03435 family)